MFELSHLINQSMCKKNILVFMKIISRYSNVTQHIQFAKQTSIANLLCNLLIQNFKLYKGE